MKLEFLFLNGCLNIMHLIISLIHWCGFFLESLHLFHSFKDRSAFASWTYSSRIASILVLRACTTVLSVTYRRLLIILIDLIDGCSETIIFERPSLIERFALWNSLLGRIHQYLFVLGALLRTVIFFSLFIFDRRHVELLIEFFWKALPLSINIWRHFWLLVEFFRSEWSLIYGADDVNRIFISLSRANTVRGQVVLTRSSLILRLLWQFEHSYTRRASKIWATFLRVLIYNLGFESCHRFKVLFRWRNWLIHNVRRFSI